MEIRTTLVLQYEGIKVRGTTVRGTSKRSSKVLK